MRTRLAGPNLSSAAVFCCILLSPLMLLADNQAVVSDDDDVLELDRHRACDALSVHYGPVGRSLVLDDGLAGVV